MTQTEMSSQVGSFNVSGETSSQWVDMSSLLAESTELGAWKTLHHAKAKSFKKLLNSN